MKIICIGRNYSNSIEEQNSTPVFFLKPDSAILIRNKPFYYPDFTCNLHHECEIVLKIVKVGKCISEKYAQSYIGGVGIGINFTAVDILQDVISKGLPWEKAKAFDFSAAVSNFISVHEFGNINEIKFTLLRNGKLAQQGNTKDMIHSFARIISHVSQFMTIKTGDLIFTGTPIGESSVSIGDKLEAFIEDKKMLSCQIK